MSGFTIYHDLVIDASTEKVFQAISEPSYLINLWPLHCTGKPNIGETYNFFFAEDYNWFGKVIELKEKESFYISMTSADSDWNPTTFGFDLKNGNNVTKLSFFHTGWKHTNEHYKRTSYCWALLLNGLKNYLEKGIVIPFKERD